MIRSSLILLAELVVLFMGVAFLVEIIQRRLGPERLKSWMGGSPLGAALKGIGVGFITPFCTYSAVPLLVGLRQAGVPAAGYVAFIVSAPVLDPVLFGALTLIVGLDVAVVYLAVAFSAALSIALVAQRIGIDRLLKPLPALATETSAPTDACEIEGQWLGLRTETGFAWAKSVSLLRSLGPLLVLGVAIGLGIEALVPPEAAAAVAGEGNRFAIPVASLLGTPLYFNTELFVPIADSLRAAGVGVGAIVALTIAGAGANLPEFVILGRLAQTRVIGAFVAYVLGVATVGGLLAQLAAV